jgi:hypothetical protein
VLLSLHIWCATKSSRWSMLGHVSNHYLFANFQSIFRAWLLLFIGKNQSSYSILRSNSRRSSSGRSRVEVACVLRISGHGVNLLPQQSRQLCCHAKLLCDTTIIGVLSWRWTDDFQANQQRYPHFRGRETTVFSAKRINQSVGLLRFGKEEQ